MTTKPYGAQSYLETEVRSATPMQLVVLLCDAAVHASGAARDAMARRDIPARRTAMNKLMGIIAELQNTLDLERGGALAERLDSIYTYLLSRLLEAVSRQSPEPIAEVQQILLTLRDGWQQVAQQSPTAAGAAGSRP